MKLRDFEGCQKNLLGPKGLKRELDIFALCSQHNFRETCGVHCAEMNTSRRKRTRDCVVDVHELVSKQARTVSDSVRTIASSNGTSEVALTKAYQRWIQRNGVSVVKYDSFRLLSGIQDRALVTLCRMFAGSGYPVGSADIRSMVHDAFDVSPSLTWVNEWLLRHKKELNFSYGKTLSKDRANPDAVGGVLDFAYQWNAAYEEEKKNISASNMFNYDESRMYFDTGKLVLKRVFRRAGRANIVLPRGHCLGSLVSFVSASGECLMHVWILSANFDDETGIADVQLHFEVRRSMRHRVPVYLGWTKTGYVDRDTLSVILEKFRSEWKLKYPLGRKCFVFSDQLRIHRDPEIVKENMAENVFLWSLPANTSHITQPLDQYVFGTLKKLFHERSQALALYASFTRQKVADLLFQVALDCADDAFTSSSIRASFAKTKLWPWNFSEFISNCERELGVEEGTSHADSILRVSTRGMGDVWMDLATFKVLSDGVSSLFQSRLAVAQGRVAAAQCAVTPVSASVRQKQLHSPQDLCKQAEEDARERERVRQAKEAAAVARTTKQNARKAEALKRVCQGHANGPANRSMVKPRWSAKSWMVCKCGSYSICSVCKLDRSVLDQFFAHQANCAANIEGESTEEVLPVLEECD